MSKTQQQYDRALLSLAGGVSSSTRLNKAINRPMLIDRAEGCRVWDLDGKEYIDLCCSHGATLLGHGDARVREAVGRALSRGAPCSYENETHAELAALLCETVPCLERLRFTGSGTEATLHCIRLARACTGRAKLLRFEGNFHGYHDQVMFMSAGEIGLVNPPLKPISTGVTPGIEQHLIQIPYNRPEVLEDIFARHAPEMAAAILEPIWFNAGCILPTKEFITTLRRLTEMHGVLLIFDEVLSAFRMCPGGAQEYLQVTPDLCTLGKSVGGGYPLSVFGGRKEFMDRLMPIGDCQHSGTYNGHPSTIAAGLAAVKAYRSPGFYEHIHAVAARLYPGMQAIFDKRGIKARVQGLGARFGVYFGLNEEIRGYDQVQRHDRQMMLRFIAAAIAHGVYFHDYGGAACHHGFCGAMTEGDAEEALMRLDDAVSALLIRSSRNTTISEQSFTPVKIGVIGLGRFGRLHALTLAGLMEAELVALVSRRQESIDAVAKELPVVPGWTDLKRAIAESGAEAWVVAATTASHVPIAKALLAVGKKVLLEKPISDDLNEARSLAPLVKPDSSNLMLGHIVLFNSEFQQLREEVAKRGPIAYVDCVRHRPASIVQKFPGENPLYAAMVHDLYAVQALLGSQEPAKFTAQYHRTAGNEIDLATAQLQWDAGPLATFTASYLTPDGMPSRGFDRMEVFGSGWSARISPNPRPIEVWDDARASWPLPLEIRAGVGGATGMMAEELRCFCRVVRGKQAVPAGATYADALQVQEWMDKLAAAAK